MRKEDDAEPTPCQVVGDVACSGRRVSEGLGTDEGTQYFSRGTMGSSPGSLTDGFGVEGRDVIIFYSKTDLNRFAAHLAIFDVGLTPDGQVQEHRNLFTTIGAVELVFHSVAGLGLPFP